METTRRFKLDPKQEARVRLCRGPIAFREAAKSATLLNSLQKLTKEGHARFDFRTKSYVCALEIVG